MPTKPEHKEIVGAFWIWARAINAGIQGAEEDVHELVRQFNGSTNYSQEAIDLVEQWFNWTNIEIFFDLEEIRSTHGKSQKADGAEENYQEDQEAKDGGGTVGKRSPV